MNVLSLFDGMACGMLALLKAGIQVNNYYAYEIDKYAVQTASHNFPDIQEFGDVFNADFKQYEGIDYLIGGSPCTYWSIAQSPDKRETTASGIGWELFSQYVRALHEAKPRYFIYENNKSMAKAIYNSISETFGFEPIMINSALVSAQNRQRYYWVGKRNDDGIYSKVDVEQPEDRGILLRDVLDGIAFKDKQNCIDANYYKGGNYSNPKKQSGQRMCVAEPVACRCRGRTDKNGNGYAKYECRNDYKSNTLDTNSTNGNMIAEPVNVTDNGKSQTIKAQYQKSSIANICKYTSTYGASGVAEPVDKSVRVGIYPTSDGRLLNSQGMRIYSIDGKSVTQSAQGGGMGAKTGLYAIPVEFDGDIPIKAISAADGKTYKVYEVKNGNITIKGKTYPVKLIDGYYIIRKLTVSECKRLQTVPEWYEFPVSATQAYKMLGNGWTVDVIAHLLKYMV